VTARLDVMMWAQRINSNKGAAAHVLLDMSKDADLDVAQAAFHKIARMAHPDLHRTGLTAEELEQVTSAYATVANAYQNYRSGLLSSQRLRPVVKDKPANSPPVAVTPSGTVPVMGAAGAMNGRALVYYRKAELALKRGDLKGAMLQIKMAIASDPQSQFLRTALSEVETEVRKAP